MNGQELLIAAIIIALVIAFIISMVVVNANAKKIIDTNTHLVEHQHQLVEMNRRQGSEIEKRMNEIEQQSSQLQQQKSELHEQKEMIASLLQQQQELAQQLKNAVPNEVAQLQQQTKEHRKHLERAANMTDEELLSWIDTQMDEKRLFTDPTLSLKKMSKALGVTQKRLGSLFKSHPKYSNLSEYLNEKRFLYACKLLREEPSWTIEAVSIEAGFGSRRSFQIETRRRLGITPVQYRLSQGLDIAPKHR